MHHRDGGRTQPSWSFQLNRCSTARPVRATPANIIPPSRLCATARWLGRQRGSFRVEVGCWLGLAADKFLAQAVDRFS